MFIVQATSLTGFTAMVKNEGRKDMGVKIAFFFVSTNEEEEIKGWETLFLFERASARNNQGLSCQPKEGLSPAGWLDQYLWPVL